MIQANELRLGNILNSHMPDGYIFTTTIDWSDLKWITEDPTDFNSVHTAIKLSKHILLDCGAYQLPHFTIMNTFYFDLGRNRQLSIGAIGTPNLMVFLQEIEKDEDGKAIKVNDIICAHNWDYDGELHLHQLQNLIHALTRIELTYNPK